MPPSTSDDARLHDWQPCPRPQRIALTGRWCRLEPLEPARHGDDLFAASMAPGADARFRYLFESPGERPAFEAWMARAAASPDPLMFAVIDAASGRCEGRQSLMRITPEHGVIEIGNILWGPAVARTRVATEALALFARHVFDELGYRRFEWKCHADNAPSRKAALRFGFQFEGIFRQHMVFKGGNRDTAWFGMTDGDWTRLRPGYEAWLAPANFDRTGCQRRSLAECLGRAQAGG
jgi:RimJ/RimL family protein N-acetyltransferase